MDSETESTGEPGCSACAAGVEAGASLPAAGRAAGGGVGPVLAGGRPWEGSGSAGVVVGSAACAGTVAPASAAFRAAGAAGVLAREISSWGSIISAPVPPRADGRKETVRPCLRASRPTTARPRRVPERLVRSWWSAETAFSARRSCTSLMTSPLSSTVMTMPAGTSSTYTWTSAVGGEKLAALSRSSASACMTPSAA
ncbi:hypothetical protein SCALM49S_05804 [Streptomyces californicus]